MEPLHRRMTIDEFHDFPRRLGWKHEYWDGQLHLSPNESAVATFRLELSARTVTLVAPIRPISPADVPALVELFQLCFRDNVEYTGWPKKAFHKAARDCVGSLFDKPERARGDASFVVDEVGQLSGAALVKLSGQSLLLGPIYVHPDHRRRGHATRLLGAVVNRLCEAGETTLYSLCHLGNPASMAWHGNNGFEEVPDLFVAQHRWRYHFEESRRLERLGDRSAAEAARSDELIWRAEVDRLEALRETSMPHMPVDSCEPRFTGSVAHPESSMDVAIMMWGTEATQDASRLRDATIPPHAVSYQTALPVTWLA